jgi:catechol 2,3-dioxygenase-like lactoylglutathione lyase family enzyme
MSVIGLNHVNIRSKDVLASAAFYEKVLRLRAGNGPMGLPPEQSRWLFDANDQPIVHLRKMDTEPGSTGPFDHVAFSCSDLDGMIEHLTSIGIKFGRFDGLGGGVTQLFLEDPHGVHLELQFAGNQTS